jgi:hypothetical protein
VTNFARITANLIEAFRGVANGKGLQDRVPMMDAAGTPDFGRTMQVDEVLAAAQYLPDDETFNEEEVAVVDAAYGNLGITRPSNSKKAAANTIATALVRARRLSGR